MNKKIVLTGMVACLLAMGTIKTATTRGVSTNAGWYAAKQLGGGEGAQWAASGAGGYAGAVAGAWGAAKAGAALGLTVGPVGVFVGGLIGAGVGAW